MDITAILRAAGGVSRIRALTELGVGDHAIRKAVRAGEATRPRRGWLALPDADAQLLEAVKNGVYLTCVTEAKRRGLWSMTDELHVAASPHSGHTRAIDAHVHWRKPLVPRGDGAPVDPIENVLAIVAECRPYEESIAIWESAMRLQLFDRDAMRELPLGPAARRVLADAKPFAGQGTESVLTTRLRWLQAALKLSMRRQVWLCGHPVDLLIGDRLVIQIDGATHVDRQRLIDNEHDLRLMLAGYHVIRIGYRQLFDDWPHVQELITLAVAQGRHLARAS